MKDYELEANFREVLNRSQSASREDKLSIADELISLLSTYQPISNEIKDSIQRWVAMVWKEEDIELIDALCTVIVNAPTIGGYQILRQALLSENEEVRKIAEEGIRDIRDIEQNR